MKIISYLLLLFTTLASAQEQSLNGNYRKWTLNNGKTTRAKLIAKIDNEIQLLINKKEHTFPLSDFSLTDRNYVSKLISQIPKGTISTYEAQFHNTSDKEFYKRNRMKSFVWEGEGKEKLPFLVYQPLKLLRKMPVIVYLHGTGGMGTDNTKPFFICGGGAAKHLVEEKFQSRHPCYIITPQTLHHSGWFSAHRSDPSNAQIWLRNTLKLMAKDKKRFSIDINRIYIMGHSMGGHGVFEALAKIPNFYAAGVSIAASNDGSRFHRDNSSTFLWVYLNQGDKSETVSDLKLLARKYKRNSGRIRVKILRGSGHNAWDKTLGDAKFSNLLFQQKR